MFACSLRGMCKTQVGVLLLLAILVQRAPAERRPWERWVPRMGVLQPAEYRSPSGTYALLVTPHERRGAVGPVAAGWAGAHYRFLRNDEEIWSSEREYALRQVIVTDRPDVVGVAYRNVYTVDEKRVNVEQWFHVVILDGDGNERLNSVEARRRPLQGYPGGPPALPWAEEVIVDSENDRIIMRVNESFVVSGQAFETQQGSAAWRIYRLSTGELVRRFYPPTLVPKGSSYRPVYAVRPVRGTPLLLVHLSLEDPPGRPADRGGRFVLLDAHLKPVWSLDLPNDYNGICEEQPDRPLWWYFRTHPAVLRVGDAGSFELRFFAQNQRVAFAVEQRDSGRWHVHEVNRVEYVEKERPGRPCQ